MAGNRESFDSLRLEMLANNAVVSAEETRDSSSHASHIVTQFLGDAFSQPLIPMPFPADLGHLCFPSMERPTDSSAPMPSEITDAILEGLIRLGYGDDEIHFRRRLLRWSSVYAIELPDKIKSLINTDPLPPIGTSGTLARPDYEDGET
jgi:hypothetical protein